MDVIFVIGAAQAFFFPLLILNKGGKSTADYVLACWFVLIGLALLAYYLEVTGRAADYPVYLGFSTCLAMLMGPAAYLYVRAVTHNDQPLRPVLLVHALPYVFFTLVVFVKLFMYPGDSVEADRLAIEDPDTPLFTALGLARIFLPPAYFVYCLVILRQHARRIAQEFSYTENIDLQWLKQVILALLTIWVVVVVVNILGNFNDWIAMETGDDLIYLTVTAAVFFGGFHGIRQQVIFSTASVDGSEGGEGGDSGPAGQYLRSSLTPEKSRKILERLLHHMEEDEPYLDGRVSLAQVADGLGVSANHLSQVINENLGRNFYEFMNGYRVERVKRRLADPAERDTSILSIAYDCGFNSKSSFNEVFKKSTGRTPSQFRKQLKP